MLNMIKMDVYRMFRTKSMYVIWIILLASALLTSFLSKIDYDAVNKEWEQQQADDSNKEQLSQQNTDNVNIGMSVGGITYGAREEGYGNGCFLF